MKLTTAAENKYRTGMSHNGKNDITYVIYEGHAKSFVIGFGLLQCYVLSNIFLLQTFKVFPPLLKHIFVTFLPSREKQINSVLLVSVGDTDK